MKIDMIAAVSRDELLTNGADPNQFNWTSQEDKDHFRDIKRKYKFLCMGSTTYENSATYNKPAEELENDVFRLILTEHPEKYQGQKIPNIRDFQALTPQEIVKIYSKKYDRCLILGGSFVYAEFMDAGLIDTLYLTIEPLNFESGTPLFANGKKIADYSLPPPEIQKNVNDRGTEFHTYRL